MSLKVAQHVDEMEIATNLPLCPNIPNSDFVEQIDRQDKKLIDRQAAVPSSKAIWSANETPARRAALKHLHISMVVRYYTNMSVDVYTRIERLVNA